MEHDQAQQEIAYSFGDSLPGLDRVGWQIRTNVEGNISPWVFADDEEYIRCLTRPGYEFRPVFIPFSDDIQAKFQALLSIAKIDISRYSDGRYWVAVHPANQGMLWWYAEDGRQPLSGCIQQCFDKAVRLRLLKARP